MSMRLEEILICDEVISDSTSGKYSLIGLFDKIAVSRYPSLHQKFFVVFRIIVSKGEHKVFVRITYPEGSRITAVQVSSEMTIKADEIGFVKAAPIKGMEFEKGGWYRVEILDGQELVLGSTRFLVEEVKEEAL